MKNLKFNKKRISALAISLVLGTSSLIGLSGCGKEKTYESKIDSNSTKVTEVFKDDTKLDEAIASGVAFYGDMPITEAVDKLEEALYIVDKVEKDYNNLLTDVPELEKLSEEDYEKAELMTRKEFDEETAKCRGYIDEKTNNVFKIEEIRLHSMKMVEHKYRVSKKFVEENADSIIEQYLLESAKGVIANETNIDGENINSIKIMHAPMAKEKEDYSVRIGNDKYIVDPDTDGIGEGIGAIYKLQDSDKKTITNNDRLKYIETGKKMTMLGARTKGVLFSKSVEILNDINYKEADNKMKRTLKK